MFGRDLAPEAFVTVVDEDPVPEVKLYLMTTSCSGKTHFHRRHAEYRGIPIVDFSKVNRAASEGREPEAALAPGESYRERVIAYLGNVDGPVTLLGRRGPEDPPRGAGIEYGVILVPESDHIRNWNARRDVRPHTRWTTFDDLARKRDKLAAYAAAWDIPVFESFTSAIDATIDDTIAAAAIPETRAPPP